MAHLGLIGIGVMGAAFAQNLAEEGHTVSMLDRTVAKMRAVTDAGAREPMRRRTEVLVEAAPRR